VQLGELQNQIGRFKTRGVSVIALSVDEPAASVVMQKRLGLSFVLGSDPEQKVVRAFGVQNPDTRELAIHAVYIIDEAGSVFYRKVGRRRPVSQELIDAIDAHRGVYPRTDETIAPRKRSAVDYPSNYFQTLLTVIKVHELPDAVDEDTFNRVYSIIQRGGSDDATIAFMAFAARSVKANQAALFDAASWLTHLLFFVDQPEALKAGRNLAQRLRRVRELEGMIKASAEDVDQKDALQQTLAKARAGLSLVQAEISDNASKWRLTRAKTTMRGYRAVAEAEIKMRQAR